MKYRKLILVVGLVTVIGLGTSQYSNEKSPSGGNTPKRDKVRKFQ